MYIWWLVSLYLVCDKPPSQHASATFVTFRIFLVIEAFSGVMNIYINMHILTIISKTVRLGDTKQNILIQKHIHFWQKACFFIIHASTAL